MTWTSLCTDVYLMLWEICYRASARCEGARLRANTKPESSREAGFFPRVVPSGFCKSIWGYTFLWCRPELKKICRVDHEPTCTLVLKVPICTVRNSVLSWLLYCSSSSKNRSTNGLRNRLQYITLIYFLDDFIRCRDLMDSKSRKGIYPSWGYEYQ